MKNINFRAIKNGFIQLNILSWEHDYIVALDNGKHLVCDRMSTALNEFDELDRKELFAWSFVGYDNNDRLKYMGLLDLIENLKINTVYSISSLIRTLEETFVGLSKAYEVYLANERNHYATEVKELLGIEVYEAILEEGGESIVLEIIPTEDNVLAKIIETKQSQLLDKIIYSNPDDNEFDYNLMIICAITNITRVYEYDYTSEYEWPYDLRYYIYREYEPKYDTYEVYYTRFNEYNAVGEIVAGYYGEWFDNLNKAIEYGLDNIQVDNLEDQKYTTHVDLMVFVSGGVYDNEIIHKERVVLRDRSEYYDKYYNHLQ